MKRRTIKVPSYALSLWQPWAHLIAIGAKVYETRSWPTMFRGPIAIHAAQRWNHRTMTQCFEEPFRSVLARNNPQFLDRSDRLRPLGMNFGAVVGVGRLADCIPTAELLPWLGEPEVAFGDFTHGRYAFLYENVVQLPEPVETRGEQGIFRLSMAARHGIERQLSNL